LETFLIRIEWYKFWRNIIYILLMKLVVKLYLKTAFMPVKTDTEGVLKKSHADRNQMKHKDPWEH
jgi:hypothetical protein